MSWCVFARHVGSNAEGPAPVVCTVGTKAAAEQIARKLSRETFIAREDGPGTRGRRVRRYSQVWVSKGEPKAKKTKVPAEAAP